MQVILHTAPPYSPQFPLERGSYRHVVGLSFEDEQLWRPSRNLYRPTINEPLQITNRDFGLRLTEFFDTYLIHGERQGAEYNCHIFAAVMTDTVELDIANNNDVFDQADDMARGIVDQGTAQSGNLPFGKQGVIGERTEPFVRYIAHSMIGLGEDRDEFLEINHTYGDLGVQRYAHSLPYYEHMHHTNGLYALPDNITPQPLGRD